MSEDLVVDAEIVPDDPQPSRSLAVRSEGPLNLFGADEPAGVIEAAEKVATALADVIQQKQLFKRIGDKDHVLVEGWTLLGSMLGVFPVVVWTRQLENGWEARVEARTRGGEVVGAAEAQCTREEAAWSWEPVGRNGQKLKPRDDFALRSMAQTRATSKALRHPLGFVVTLAGYEATPADERDGATDSRVGGENAGAASSPPAAGEKISAAQHRKIGAMLKELMRDHPTREGQRTWVDELKDHVGVVSRKDMTKEQASRAIEFLQSALDAEKTPFA